MTSLTPALPSPDTNGAFSRLPLPLRFALREMRGGLRGFYVFIACIALGVMAISGVMATAQSLVDGLAHDGRTILGGDLAFSLIHREVDAGQKQFLSQYGALSTVATMRAMARKEVGDKSDGQTALVDIKAVDSAYPLVGTLGLDPPMALPDLFAEKDGAYGAAVDPSLLAQLGLSVGDRVSVGNTSFQLRSSITDEPDKIAGGIAYGPRFLISDQALRATGLVQPGSLIRWHYRLRLPENATDRQLQTVIDATKARYPDSGMEVRTRRNVSPQLERDVDRFTQFLTLVGLTSLLIGGVGVANAVTSHLDRKRNVIATLKATGATGGSIFLVYLAQVLMLAAIGTLIGLCIGAAMPFAVKAAFGTIIPLPMAPALHPVSLAVSAIYGLLTALAFAFWPLGRAHDIRVSALFRDEVEATRQWPRLRYVIGTLAAAAILVTLAIALAYDRKIAAVFVASAIGVLIVLRLLAAALMTIARRAPRAGHALVRLAIANIHRPGALTPTVVLSLGLGLSLLVTLVEIDGNLRNQFAAALPDRAPSFFFIDIPAKDGDAFAAFIHQHAPDAALETVPMLRGRIVSANNIPADKIKPDSDAAWVLQSDRGISYTDTVPQGSRIVAGKWWGKDYDGPPQVSFERKLANGLHLKIGDPVTVNVLGRTITAKISNLRDVDWQSLGINFVMVFSPNTFRGAPHTHIATLTYNDGSDARTEGQLLRDMSKTFPTITAVRVKEVLEAVATLVSKLVLGIRGASLITLLAAGLVLGGALAAGHRHRVYDAVILKTLGATRAKLLAAYTLEYCLLGSVTAVLGVGAGSVAAWLVVTRSMSLPFTWQAGPALLTVFGGLVFTVILGLIGTYSALGHKPAPVLRNL